MRAFVVVIVVLSAACATVSDDLAHGRLHAACEKEMEDVDAAPLVNAWLEKHVAVELAALSAAEV